MKRLSLLVLCILFGMTKSLAGNENWMSGLNGNLYITQLSLPGAHDAATGEGFSGASALGAAFAGKCQSLGLAAQWDAGVRVFDLRPTEDDGCPINHGTLQTKVNLTQALTTITSRLAANPSEFALVLMRNESDKGSSDNWKTRVPAVLSAFTAYVIPFNSNLRLQDVRGKVVILSRDYFAAGYSLGSWPDKTERAVVTANGDDGFKFVVQDYYQVEDANTKQNAIKALLAEARSQTSPNFLFINHTSGYSGSTGTNSNISSNAKASNKCALDEINANPGHVGIILMDFAGTNSSNYYGEDLCNAIIAQNNRLSGLNLATLPDNTDYYLQNVETGLWLQGNNAKTTTSRDGWNTAANMGSYGRPFRLQNYAADGYTLNTQSGPNALGCNYGDASLLYLDGSIGPSRWKITGTREAARITVNWDRWLSVDAAGRLVNNNPASTWRIWTRQERIAALADATEAAPSDATWLLVNPELMNNDNRSPQWSVQRSGGNEGWPDGFRPNRVYETWNFSSLDFSQTVSGLPNGRYLVQAHAMYSPTGIGETSIGDYNDYVQRGDATVFASLYANGREVKLPSIYSFTNNAQVPDYTYRTLASGVNIVDGWWQIARAMGEDDRFVTAPLEVLVTDGTLHLGIHSLPGHPASNWVVIGSFQLLYLGAAMSLDVNISDAGYATFVAPFEASMPAGVTASVATVNANGVTVDLTPVAGAVPAHTPVILSAEAPKAFTVSGTISAAAAPELKAGALVGTYADIPAPDASYVLQQHGTEVGFYVIGSDAADPQPIVNAYRAYLLAPAAAGTKAFVLSSDATTAIGAVPQAQQMASDVQPLGNVFDLSGRRLSLPSTANRNLSPGLYIIGGRKVVVK